MIVKFAKKLFLLALPFVLFSMLPLSLGIYFGDLLPTSQIIALQEIDGGLYDPLGVRENLIDYKLQMALHSQADFLVLGSSRLHFLTADAITNPDYSFYNGAANGLSPTEMLAMLQVIAEQGTMPSILFINLDIGTFNNERVEFIRNNVSNFSPNLGTEFNRIYHAFQDISLDLILDPQGMFDIAEQINQAPSRSFVGKASATTGRGHGIDGNLERNFLGITASHIVKEHQRAWDNRNKMYEIGSSVDQENLMAVHDIIEIAQAHNTLIIAVLPPYHPQFYALLQDSQEHRYFDAAREAIAQGFENSGMLLYDFTNPSQTNIEPNMFFDGWHLGEVGTLQMYLQIVNDRPDLLAQYSDVEQLNDLLENAASSLKLRD